MGRGVNALVRIARMTLRHPWQVGIAIGATIVAAVLQLMIPRLLGQAVDQAQGVLARRRGGAAQTRSGPPRCCCSASRWRAASSRWCRTTIRNRSATMSAYELRLAFYEKVQRLCFSFHDRVHSGDLITLGMLDIDGVRMFFATGLVRVVLLAVLIGVGAYMLLSTDVLLGLLALSFVPFVAWRSSVAQLTLRATWLELQERLSALTRVMEENLGGIRVVRAFAGAGCTSWRKFDEASQARAGAGASSASTSASATPRR